MKRSRPHPEAKGRKMKRAVQAGLALFAASLLTLIYLRTI